MDSVTQFVLGAAVGVPILKRNPRKAALLGGFVATIPDLDVFLAPLFDPITFKIIHRSFSHSILFAVFFAIVLALLLYKFKQVSLARGWTFSFMVLITHSLLDVFTTYGTQLFWPFYNKMCSFNSLPIIDPIYTSILLVPLILIFIKQHIPFQKVSAIFTFCLFLSSAYIGWSLVSKTIASSIAIESLKEQQINYTELKVTPTVLNTVLWQIIAKDDENNFYFSDYSLFDADQSITFHKMKSKHDLLSSIENDNLTRRYLHFCDGYEFVAGDKDNIEIYAVKFGAASLQKKPTLIMPFTATNSNGKYEYSINKNDQKEVLSMYMKQIRNRLLHY